MKLAIEAVISNDLNVTEAAKVFEIKWQTLDGNQRKIWERSWLKIRTYTL